MWYWRPGVSPGPPSQAFPVADSGPPCWLAYPKVIPVLAATSVHQQIGQLILPSPLCVILERTGVHFLHPMVKKKKKQTLILATSDPEQGHPLCTYMKQVCLCSAPPPPECFPVCMESVRPPHLPSPEHSFLSPPPPPLVVAANSTFSSLQQLCWAADNTSEWLKHGPAYKGGQEIMERTVSRKPKERKF